MVRGRDVTAVLNQRPDWKWTAVGAVTYFLFSARMFMNAYFPNCWPALGARPSRTC